MAKAHGVIVYGSLVLLLITIQIAKSTDLQQFERYDVDENLYLPKLDKEPLIVRLRQKRQIQTDLKNQYQSVATTQQQNATSASATTANPSGNGPDVVVPPYTSDNGRPLLGVNGTGQRKELSKPSSVNVDTLSGDGGTGKQIKLNSPKKVMPSLGATPTNADETMEERVIDNIDIPDEDAIEEAKKKNYSVNQTTDYHNYYNSTIYVNKEEAQSMWDSIKNINHSSMLSHSHRRAMTVELTFDFPFYGHPVRNITVATGGFLYTGEYVHSWLAATQYIAPLMANFDTSLNADSFVRLHDNGTAFIVIWENVTLQDKPEKGKFTFSTILHKSGDIVFTYYQIPLDINSIDDDKHPVKVGLSDAYIIDKVVYYARRKTIFEYHRVNLASTPINNNTIIYLKALPTCHSYTDCVACMNHDTSFDCTWCPILNRCSTGTDRRKQEWMTAGCDRAQITAVDTCPALGAKGNNAAATQASNSNGTQTSNNSNNSNNTSRPFINHDLHDHGHDDAMHPSEYEHGGTIAPLNVKPVSAESKTSMKAGSDVNAEDGHHNHEPKSMGVALGVMVPICLIMAITLWVFYAYRNPHTKSGQLLIQYRPSQWSWRRGEARYTAATIHM